MTAEGKTKGDGRAEFSAGENRDAGFLFSTGSSAEQLRWLLGLQTASLRTDAAAGETDCSRSKLDYSLGLVLENKMSLVSLPGRFLSGRSREEVQGRCVEIDAAVELIKKLH